MKILVTGANGFIGRRLFERLKAQGHRAVALSRDITKPFSVDGRFDVVIHLAAHNITNIGDQDKNLYEAVNVDGTKHLLQAVETGKFIYLSTTKVYKNEGLRLTEESPLAPQGAYEQSKLKAEDVCRSFFKKDSLVIFRSVNVMGWGQAPKAVLPVFFQKAKANQALDIINSPRALVQFVYVEDLIDAIEACVSRENAGGIFNIAHPEAVSIEQLARKIIAMAHSSSNLNISENAPEALFSPVICDKAYQQLRWKAKTGIARILELYEEEHARAA